MSKVKEWFERSAGEWISNRRYYYEASGKNQLVKSDLKVEMKPSNDKEFIVELNWDSKGDVESVGSMICEFDSNKNILYRNIGYMTADPTFSEVTMIDEDTILFKTEYDGMTFREEIRLIDKNVRLRQTLGWKRDTVFLAGQYYEKRK
jgi:CpeS-like protein